MKIKRIFASLLAAAVVGTAMPAVSLNMPEISMISNAADYTEGTYESLTYKAYGDHIEITGCNIEFIGGNDDETEIVIPSEIDGLPVTSIGDEAFSNCLAVSAITIPDSVTNIGVSAFVNCSMTSINIPNSVTNIGDAAFSGCFRLTSIIIPNGIANIGESMFEGCSDLAEVTISGSVTNIGDGAFFDCKNLTKITLPESVKSIGDHAFYNTPWLENKQKENPLVIVNDILIDGTTCSGDVVIPEGVTNIGNYAFYECSALTKITIPDSVTNIGDYAFEKCSGLTEITIPDGVTNIGNYAFGGCSGLTSITVPESVTTIGRNAFYNTQWLANKQKENPLVIVNGILIDGTTCSGDVIIPEGVTTIGSNAFSSCSLKTITIPESVKSIGGNAFYNTPWLANKQKEDPLVIVNGILIDGTTCSGDVVIPEGVTSIGSSAFSSCSLKTITIPESVKSIGNGAFKDCEFLTSITIENPECEIYDSKRTISTEYYFFNGTIYGHKNSTAQAYAEKYDYMFVPIGEAPAFALGDVNGDRSVDSSDATDVLTDYSLTSTGKESNLTDAQKIAADVDKDGKIDSSDASIILQFYAYISTGGTETDMSKWLTK
ncbi:MAG: leucine-rich repeat protein [Ruminococcus sp.]|nr:leucine-rich repeat protein [Ruminococcus sp.]